MAEFRDYMADAIAEQEWAPIGGGEDSAFGRWWLPHAELAPGGKAIYLRLRNTITVIGFADAEELVAEIGRALAAAQEVADAHR